MYFRYESKLTNPANEEVVADIMLSRILIESKMNISLSIISKLINKSSYRQSLNDNIVKGCKENKKLNFFEINYISHIPHVAQHRYVCVLSFHSI